MARRAKTNGGQVFQQTLKLVSPAVNKYIQHQIHHLSLPSDLKTELLCLPKKRQDKKIMRPTLTYLVYKVCGGNRSLEEICPLLAISELNNYYCYLDNWILDNKNGISEDINEIRKTTISSQILRDLTQKVIENASIDDCQKRRISTRLAETTMQCYDGQFKDLNMTVDSLADYTSAEMFLKEYLEKSKLQSGYLYGLSGEIGEILSGSESNIANHAMNILGTGIHTSNDLGDFAILFEEDGSFKAYQDQYADIINGRLTYPSYYTLKHGNTEEKCSLMKLVGNPKASERDKLDASNAIMTSGAFSSTKKILNDFCREYKKTIKQFLDCAERDALSSVGNVIRNNKYLAALKNGFINH